MATELPALARFFCNTAYTAAAVPLYRPKDGKEDLGLHAYSIPGTKFIIELSRTRSW